MMKAKILGLAALVTFLVGAIGGVHAETLKLGISHILSGPGAAYGIAGVWTAKQAVERINKAGGVKAEGKTYTLEIIAYDNKYNAADGAKVAQTLINQDGVKFIVASGGPPGAGNCASTMLRLATFAA